MWGGSQKLGKEKRLELPFLTPVNKSYTDTNNGQAVNSNPARKTLRILQCVSYVAVVDVCVTQHRGQQTTDHKIVSNQFASEQAAWNLKPERHVTESPFGIDGGPPTTCHAVPWHGLTAELSHMGGMGWVAYRVETIST